MTQRSTSRAAFQKAFLSAVAGSSALYQDPPPYEAYIPKTTVAQTFAQVGLSMTTAARLERHDRRATLETVIP
jgi:hypothetical protein